MAANRPRPTNCPCGESLSYGAWALVMHDGTLSWDHTIHQPHHMCLDCSIHFEEAGAEVMWLPTDEQIQDQILNDLADIGIN